MSVQYLIWVQRDSDADALLAAPVPEASAAFLQRAEGHLRPLSWADYAEGPAVILTTLARWSYVLRGEDVFWLAEWAPGLVAARFTPGGAMAWVALRSPVPGFGGRPPLPEDVERYDEGADDPLHHLAFDAWDAQFEAEVRAWNGFAPAGPELQARFDEAMAAVHGRVGELERVAGREGWHDRCVARMEAAWGEGVRLY